jgi:hypothetical protein
LNSLLQLSWWQVRRDFFPRWYRGSAWQVRHGTPEVVCAGYHDHARPVITVADISPNADQRDRLLIHAICHAVTAGGCHGEPWRRRMCQAAERARALGREILAEMLIGDAASSEQR